MSLLVLGMLTLAPADALWEAPAGCPGPVTLEQRVEALLVEPSRAPISYRGRIEATDVGYRLTVRVHDVERVVEGEDCARLTTAAALIIAVEHDPVAVAARVDPIVQRPREVEPELGTEPRETFEPEPRAASEVQPTIPEGPDTSPVVRGTARLGMGAEFGLLPPIGAVFSVAGGLMGEGWRAELDVAGSLPRDVALEGEGAGARAALLAGRARGCWSPGVERVQAPLCGGLELGAMWARGYGDAVTPRARMQLWAAALLSAGVDLWFSERVGLSAEVELDVALRKPAVHLDNIGEVFRTGAVGARLLLGPRVRFP